MISCDFDVEATASLVLLLETISFVPGDPATEVFKRFDAVVSESLPLVLAFRFRSVETADTGRTDGNIGSIASCNSKTAKWLTNSNIG